ncbi:MAG: GTPase Era [Chitinophagaceae bacterium]|nr:GTPase Era [Chitinophagaceae bacterium]
MAFQSGFVGIFGKPNAGKSTLMNALMGEKLAITSPKAQTTRNKILGILSEKEYQIIFSDTPGILKRNYKLHDRMLQEIEHAKQGTDVVLFLMDVKDNVDENIELLKELKIASPVLVVLNKIDKSHKSTEEVKKKFLSVKNVQEVLAISAKEKLHLDVLMQSLLRFIPDMPAYYNEDSLSDKPMRFFVSEIIREKIFDLLDDELPYHCAVIIRAYEEKQTLTKISADIVLSRESQKGILLGSGGSMIKKIGQLAREDIERFIERKVFLEIHVKVRKDWRNNDLYLKEYGY